MSRTTDDPDDGRRPQDFAGQLRRLIAVMHPLGEPPLSDRAIAARVRANGGSISAGYVADLRTGNKTNISLAHAQHLAAALGTTAGYFTDPEVYERVSQELDRLEDLHSRHGQGQNDGEQPLVELAARTAALSDAERTALAALIQRELSARQPSEPPNSSA